MNVAGYELVEPKEEAILLCALICHNVIKALNDRYNEPTVDWEICRESTITGVKAVLENPKITPGENHEKWLAYKQAEGWVYGAVKDPEKKTHPCMLPYEALAESQKIKDVIFGSIVRTFFGL